MDLTHLLVQLIIAILCAGAATVLIPRRVPGKLVGLILIGLAGVWLGEWGYTLLSQEYGIEHEVLRWNIQDVLIIPAVLGSAIILYLVTMVLRWARYT